MVGLLRMPEFYKFINNFSLFIFYINSISINKIVNNNQISKTKCLINEKLTL